MTKQLFPLGRPSVIPSVLITSAFLCLFVVTSSFAFTAQERGFEASGLEAFTEALLEEPVFGGDFYLAQMGPHGGEELLLVHGMDDETPRAWESVIGRLAEKRRVTAIHLPGFGLSAKGNHLYSPANYAQFLDWFTQKHMKSGYTLVGHSMGGAIALRFAGSRPEGLKRLALVSAAGILHRVAFSKHIIKVELPDYMGGNTRVGELFSGVFEEATRIAKSAIDKAETRLTDKTIRAILESPLLRQQVLRGTPAVIAAMALAEDNQSGLPEKVNVPTLILWGEDDPTAPVRTGKLLERLIGDSVLRIWPGVGHVPMSERPSEFVALLGKWIDGKIKQDTEDPPPKVASRHVRAIELLGENFGVITGDYASISLVDCSNVELRKVSAETISIVGSGVRIVDSEIGSAEGGLRLSDSAAKLENVFVDSSDVGLTVIRSSVTATNLEVRGGTAILSISSNFDLAGASLFGDAAAVVEDSPPDTGGSTFVFSLSGIEKSGYIAPLHDFVELAPGQSLR